MSFTEQDIIDMEAEYERIDAEYRASLTPGELRAYRLYIEEIAAECPNCGANDVELSHDSGPDMIGDWWSTTCTACNQVINSGSDGAEAVR